MDLPPARKLNRKKSASVGFDNFFTHNSFNTIHRFGFGFVAVVFTTRFYLRPPFPFPFPPPAVFPPSTPAASEGAAIVADVHAASFPGSST